MKGNRSRRITTELFEIPWGEHTVVYSPLQRAAVLLNDAGVNLLCDLHEGRLVDDTPAARRVLKVFSQLGFIGGPPDRPPPAGLDEHYLPTAATLFLTSACNLRCVYCYAAAGERRAVMSRRVARAAVDYVVENAIIAGSDGIELGFHGGGEPTLAWRRLTDSVTYARAVCECHGLRLHVDMATNAVLTPRQTEWIVRHVDGVNVSLDGPPDVQDRQRPLWNGRGSFARVARTLAAFDRAEFPYGIRATITDTSVGRMAEIVQFLIERFQPQVIHLEPVFECGRCATTGCLAPRPEAFIAGYRSAAPIAEARGVRLYYSGARFDTITTRFCAAAGDAFSVTVDGDVTACYEVCRRDDPRSADFYIGRYDPEADTFTIDRRRQAALRRRNVTNMPACQACFCKWHCAGDCLAKAALEPGRRRDQRARCTINRALTGDEIVRLLQDSGAPDAGTPDTPPGVPAVAGG